ncbi:MAG: serine/threonine-protein phosphatase [Proteobacteria bacterium SW_6_67_9]|nr:MAG: serine/threonine-protein phosphatase [Proteobacteria bacterium SW_6_67_9]
MSHGFRAIGCATDVGAVRDHNEDAYRANASGHLLVVADGMGGHAAGEVASRITVDTVEAAVMAEGLDLVDALARAHANVVSAGADGRGHADMGTTCVACRTTVDGMQLAWVGDSRAYRYRGRTLEALTRDHSYVQSLVDAGVIDADRAESHPDRHILARCIGTSELSRSDIDRRAVAVGAGDRILLCSDGLTGQISAEAIGHILGAEGDDQEAADALVRAAVNAGGEDNVTVIVASVA